LTLIIFASALLTRSLAVVEVTNGNNETLYRRRCQLRGGYGEEGTEAFSGRPTQIVVITNRLGTVRRQWPATDCEGSHSAGGSDTYLTAEEVQVQPDCSTQYIE